MKEGGATGSILEKMNKPFFEVDELPKAQREKVKKLLGNAVDKSFESLTKSEVDKLMKELGLMPRKGPAKPPSKSDMKTLEDRMKRAKKKMTGGAMKTKGMAKGGMLGKVMDATMPAAKAMMEKKAKKRGGPQRSKMAKGGAMKTKGMAKGGMMKSKGMAKGGAMKTKGGNKGGVKRNMRPPSSSKSGLYGR